MSVETAPTTPEPSELAAELYAFGSLYAEQAAILARVANHEAVVADGSEMPLDPLEAQSRASYAALCAQFFAAAAERAATGKYDAEFLEMVLGFVNEEALADDVLVDIAS